MESTSVPSWLWWMAFAGGSGAFIDFVVGKAGQRKIRDWLETNWYRAADIQWRYVGRLEAVAYVRLLDNVFGRRIFCYRRIRATLVALILVICTTLSVYFLSPHERDYGQEQYYLSFGWKEEVFSLLLFAIAFSISISLTRIFSRLVAHLSGDKAFTNVVLFAIVLIFCYVSLILWLPLTKALWLTGRLWILTAINSQSSGEIYTYARENAAGAIATIAEVMSREVRLFSYWTPSHLLGSYRECYVVSSSSRVGSCSVASYEALSNAASVLRFIVALTFVFSFFFYWTIKQPAMLIWRRLVESDKPVFTLLLGGLGSLAATVSTLTKHLS